MEYQAGTLVLILELRAGVGNMGKASVMSRIDEKYRVVMGI